MISRIIKFFSVLGQVDLLRQRIEQIEVSTDKRVSLLEQQRMLLREDFRGLASASEDRTSEIREAAQIHSERLSKLESLFYPDGSKKVYIKQFIDKDTNELVNQEIHETREKRV